SACRSVVIGLSSCPVGPCFEATPISSFSHPLPRGCKSRSGNGVTLIIRAVLADGKAASRQAWLGRWRTTRAGRRRGIQPIAGSAGLRWCLHRFVHHPESRIVLTCCQEWSLRRVLRVPLGVLRKGLGISRGPRHFSGQAHAILDAATTARLQ